MTSLATFAGVDPAKKRYHYAHIDSHGYILRCGTYDIGSYPFNEEFPNYLAVEQMQVYKGVANSIPSDLLDVNLSAGRVMGALEVLSQGYTRVESVLPRVWKGQIPKAVTKARQLAKGYTDEMLISSGAQKRWLEDIRDALGIALWIKGKING